MLYLREYTAEDGEKIVSWIKNEKSFRLWCAAAFERFPFCADDLNGFYQKNISSAQGYIAEDEGEAVGHLYVQKLDDSGKKIKFGLIIVDNAKRGMGYGKQMLKAAISLAFEIMNAESVCLCVFDNNISAKKCYESLGFVKTDVFTEHSFFGEEWKYYDMILKK